MKRTYINILMATSLLCAMVSCEDMMDVHKDYIREGETIYAPKVDSVAFIAGRERIMFRFWLYNALSVKSVNVSWNNNEDFLSVPVTPSTGLDSMDVVLTGMPEQSYTFIVHTIDKYEHTSLTTTGFGTSYGELFQSGLSHRRIKNVTMTGEGGEITWFAAAENLVRNEIRYEKTDGTVSVVIMPANLNEILCPDALPASFFEYRSLFIPEEAAIDTFEVSWTKYDIAFPGN